MATMTHRLIALFTLWISGLLVACASTGEPAAVTHTPVPTVDATITAIRSCWEQGPHADTYDLEHGPNTYCARCHSPRNWDPVATIDPPPNCVSCKFSFESEPRVAAGNPLVPPEEWQSIGCEICHLQHDGQVESGIAWLNVTTGFHESVSGATELCEHCHLDEGMILHKRALGETVHVDFSCADCHDAHDATASCTAVGCHEEVDMTVAPPEAPLAVQLYPAIAHSVEHQNVLCVACHDASGLEVGHLEGGSTWVTFRNRFFLERMTTDIYQSHNLQKNVDCARCHYPDNPWMLEQYANAE
jgi:hypothetical protein